MSNLDVALRCTRCRLSETRTQVVPGVGDSSAALVFIGEAPGRDEDLKGVPFVGSAGKVLDGVLAHAGISRDRVYITNLVKCRPPGNRRPKDDEVEACARHLEAELGAIRPKVVCLLGQTVAKKLLRNDSAMRALVGKEFPLSIGGREVRALVAYHPAACLYRRENCRKPEGDRQALRRCRWSSLRSQPMARNRACLQSIILLFSSVSLLSVPLLSTGSAISQDEPTWTVMVYMAADAEPALPWEEDINEMEAADLTDWMDVVVLVDPLGFGDSALLHVEKDTSTAIVSSEIDDDRKVIPMTGEVDMASPDTLKDFVTFTARNYPSDRFALVLWGHGGGWYGLCQDGSSALRLPDLGSALAAATNEIGKKLDIVIADTCVEGVIETMYELRYAADWYVGSEMIVPAQGLRYDLVLSSLSMDRSVSPSDWGAHICEIHRMTLSLDSWSATMATFDLSALDGFAGNLEALSSSMEGYASIYRGTLMGALHQTAASDLVEWYLDMGDALKRIMTANLPLEVRYKAFETLRAYDALIYDFEVYVNPSEEDFDIVSNYTGAAAYAPCDDQMDEPYWSVSFSGVGWGNATSLIRSEEPTTVSQPGPEVTFNDTDSDGELDEATLHWDLDCDRYAAWAFYETDAGMLFAGRFESDVPTLRIDGIAGELTVSASAWTQGSVVSHHDLEHPAETHHTHKRASDVE